MEPLSHSSAGEAIDQVPLVVLAKRVTSHRHSAIVVKSVDRIERPTTNIFGAHQNAMRKFVIDQRTCGLASCSGHVLGAACRIYVTARGSCGHAGSGQSVLFARLISA